MSLSILAIVVVTLAWCLVVGEFALRNVLLGVLFGAAIVLPAGIGRGRTIPLRKLPRRLYLLAIYLVVVVFNEFLQSNLDMAARLLRRTPDIRPGIVRLHLGPVSEPVAALVAHTITLGPGQLIVDFSEDARTLYIHTVDVRTVDTQQAAFWRIYRSVLQRLTS